MDNLKKVVANNILELRTLYKMTQLELGAHLNYSDKAISKWERAEALPDVYILKQMAELFNVSVDYILSEHLDINKSTIPTNHSSKYVTITKISILGVWTLAVLIFVVFWLFHRIEWLIFIYAVPSSLIVLLTLKSIWHNYIKIKNFYIVSTLLWSIIATIYLSLLKYNWWLIFVLGIPSQAIIYLSFKLIYKHKK